VYICKAVCRVCDDPLRVVRIVGPVCRCCNCTEEHSRQIRCHQRALACQSIRGRVLFGCVCGGAPRVEAHAYDIATRRYDGSASSAELVVWMERSSRRAEDLYGRPPHWKWRSTETLAVARCCRARPRGVGRGLGLSRLGCRKQGAFRVAGSIVGG
jgi:hypothetical protein